MNTLTAAALSLTMMASASAQTPASPASAASAATDERLRLKIAKGGTQASTKGPATNFLGSVRIDPVFQVQETTRAAGSYVTFEPGARTAWHTHPNGQTLVVTQGAGRVQRWGDAPQEIRPGDVVWIPAGQKHWHGAAPRTSMTHLAITEARDGKSVDWLEMVSEEQYLSAADAK